VKVQVSSTVANAGTAHGSAVFDVVAGSGPEPPPPPPPDANPLEVSIELNRVIAPPQEEPVVQVTAAVSQDGAPVSGAAVDFDFTSDGTVDADRTTAGEGRASAQHDYPDGTHTVTVNARSGDTAGTASRTFTWNNGQITAAAKPAGAKGRRFTARLGLVTLKEGRFSRRGRTLRRTGELSIGSMSGKFRRRAPARLKAFLASTWLTRSTISFDRKRGRVRVSGIAVATFAAQPGQACVRYSVSSRPRRRFGKGRLSLLGGAGAAATARGVANMRVTSRRGRFVLDGRLVTGTVPARGLTPACESLLRQVRALPG
jgi:hypothetical protein